MMRRKQKQKTDKNGSNTNFCDISGRKVPGINFVVSRLSSNTSSEDECLLLILILRSINIILINVNSSV